MRTTAAPAAQRTSAVDGAKAAPVLAPARPFAAPAVPRGSDAGHDFGDVAVRADAEGRHAPAEPASLARSLTRPPAGGPGSGAPIQRAPPKKPKVIPPGTQHHNPAKKKHLASGVGATQNAVSAEQLRLIQASAGPVDRKELKRQAKEAVKNK
jgi:hypothetical protein